MKEVSQVERLLTIISLLSSNDGLTIKQISKKLENDNIFVTTKTVKRDLDSISKDFYVYEEQINKETYYFAKKYCLDKFTFSTLEMMSLYFSLKVFSQYENIQFAKCFIELINKILKHTINIDKDKLNQFDTVFNISTVNNYKEEVIDLKIIEKIQNAILNNKKIEIQYQNFNNTKTNTRIVDSYFLDIYENCYHLIALCNTKNDIRDFRVSRIKSIKVLDLDFKKDIHIEEKIKKGRLSSLYSTDQINIKIKFNKEIAPYIKEFECSKADKIEELEDGSLIFIRKTSNTPELIRWVLQYGKNAVVLEPKSLKEDILSHIQALQNEYKMNGV